jgi:1-phosphatidylinositol phosphodiesterase
MLLCFSFPSWLIRAWVGDFLLSDSAQLEDVLWGLYNFLDAHPTETIMVSLKIDHGDVNDPTLQNTLYSQFTTAPTSDYWVQAEIVRYIPSCCTCDSQI